MYIDSNNLLELLYDQQLKWICYYYYFRSYFNILPESTKPILTYNHCGAFHNNLKMLRPPHIINMLINISKNIVRKSHQHSHGHLRKVVKWWHGDSHDVLPAPHTARTNTLQANVKVMFKLWVSFLHVLYKMATIKVSYRAAIKEEGETERVHRGHKYKVIGGR